MTRKTTLPTDSEQRKGYPLLSGCLNYFPAALAGVARWSVLGNTKHNPPGEPLHHARGKSMDHGDCIIRHTMDLEGFMAQKALFTDEEKKAILDEVDARSWRALADAQRVHELFGAPLAPAARVTTGDMMNVINVGMQKAQSQSPVYGHLGAYDPARSGIGPHDPAGAAALIGVKRKFAPSTGPQQHDNKGGIDYNPHA